MVTVQGSRLIFSPLEVPYEELLINLRYMSLFNKHSLLQFESPLFCTVVNLTNPKSMTDLHLLLSLCIIIIISIFIPKGVHSNPGIPRVPGILVLPLLPCCQPTSCSISNLIPRVFHIFKMVRRERPSGTQQVTCL